MLDPYRSQLTDPKNVAIDPNFFKFLKLMLISKKNSNTKFVICEKGLERKMRKMC